MAKVKMYTGFERLWHWAQAILIVLLAVTGFEIHGTYELFGYQSAVEIHNLSFWILIVLTIFAVFWHIVTGAWRQYIPTSKNLRAQVQYYTYGIFINAPHPTHKTRYTKFNPLQKLTYLQLKLFAFPIQGITGLLYFYNDSEIPFIGVTFSNLELFALVHLLGAYFFVVFLIVHVYLTTTGSTLTSNLMGMITGWEDEEEEDE